MSISTCSSDTQLLYYIASSNPKPSLCEITSPKSISTAEGNAGKGESFPIVQNSPNWSISVPVSAFEVGQIGKKNPQRRLEFYLIVVGYSIIWKVGTVFFCSPLYHAKSRQSYFNSLLLTYFSEVKFCYCLFHQLVSFISACLTFCKSFFKKKTVKLCEFTS